MVIKSSSKHHSACLPGPPLLASPTAKPLQLLSGGGEREREREGAPLRILLSHSANNTS